MMDKIKIAVDAARALFTIGGAIMEAVRDGDVERVDEILPAEDRARLHLLALEAQARRDLPSE